MNILGYSGVLGVVAYLAYTLLSFMSARKIARFSLDNNKARFAAGGKRLRLWGYLHWSVAGYIITPEYWILIGLSIYLSIRGPSLHACVQSGRV